MTSIGFRRYYSSSPARKLDGCLHGCCLNVAVRKYKKTSHRLARRTNTKAVEEALLEVQQDMEEDAREWADYWKMMEEE